MRQARSNGMPLRAAIAVAHLVALAALSGACSAASVDTPRAGPAAGSGGSIGMGAPTTPPANPPALCSVGANPCYCPDGQRSGTQTCDARHELSACQCAVSAASTVQQGVQGDPKRVCSQLVGKSNCDARSYASPQLPSSMLFVVDRSGSMSCNPPPTQTVESCNANPQRADPSKPSKWEITIGALDGAFAGLKGSAAAVGLSMFSTDGFCGVDSTPIVGLDAISTTHLGALSDAMHENQPAGGTPIVGSLISAYHHLHEELHAAGNRYVVLITDGEESCGTLGDEHNTADLAAARNRLLQTEVQKARDANIRTFVVGSPGSENARGFLSELAFRGGTARNASCTHGDPAAATGDCHYDLTTQQDFAAVLRTTLGQISGQARGCEFQSPGGSSMINVQVSSNGGAPQCFNMDPKPCDGGANGWQFPKLNDGTPDTSRVVLCGPACDMIKQDPTSVVDVILGCIVLQ
jgi:hypothetical protein